MSAGHLLSDVEGGEGCHKDNRHGHGVTAEKAAEGRIGAGHQPQHRPPRHAGRVDYPGVFLADLVDGYVCVVDLQEAQTDCAPGQDVVYFGAGPAATELENWMQITGMRATELVTVAASRSVREWIS